MTPFRLVVANMPLTLDGSRRSGFFAAYSLVCLTSSLSPSNTPAASSRAVNDDRDALLEQAAGVALVVRPASSRR